MDVVALGELLIDFACLDTDRDGYPTMAAHPGGAPCNFLAALSKYGARTAFLGKVGDDAFGALLRRTLEQSGWRIEGKRGALAVLRISRSALYDKMRRYGVKRPF